MPIPKQKYRFTKTLVYILFLSIISIVSLYKVVNHGLYLSPDSYIYLDIAQNIYQGRGIVHSFVLTSELERWEGSSTYIPVGYWAFGFPMYICFLKSFGQNIPFPTIGALSVWTGFVLTLITLTLMLARYHGFRTALWGMLLFFLFYPFVYSYSWVWSDGLVIPFMLTSLCLITDDNKSYYKAYLLLGGVIAGVAFSIRYIQGILLPFGLLIIFFFILALNNPLKVKIGKIWVNGLIYLSGWACISIPVMVRNIITTGAILGTPRSPRYIPVSDNIRYAFTSLIKEWFAPHIIPSEIQGSILLSLVLICILLLIIRKSYIKIKESIYNRFILVLFLWGIVYFFTIVFYSSFYQIDTLSHRLLLPAYIVLIILISVLCEKIFPFPAWIVAVGVVLAGIYFCYLYPYGNIFFSTTDTFLKDNARVEWICSHTQPEDWIIGDSTFDITLLCGNRRSLCFVPGAIKDTSPDKKDFDIFFKKISLENSRVFIVLRKGVPFEDIYYDSWVQCYGEVITKLFFTGKYENIIAINTYSGKGFISAEIRLQGN